MPKNLENIKDEIIQITREMIIERGYDHLNIRDIAKKCGIATGTFYNYFRSKQAIISSLLEEDWIAFKKFIGAQGGEGMPPMEQMEKLFHDLRQMMHNVHQIWAAGFPDDLESGTLNKIKTIKIKLRNEFAQHIRLVIKGHIEAEREAFAADLITRLFFSYAYDNDARFDDLRFFLEKMLDR